MEGRSIIHKMHVLERSFLPELKYSTSHSYHPLLPPPPGPIPSGLDLSASSTKRLLPPPFPLPPRPPMPTPTPSLSTVKPACLSPPFLTCRLSDPARRAFLRLADATRRTLIPYELAGSFERNFSLNLTDRELCNALKPPLASHDQTRC